MYALAWFVYAQLVIVPIIKIVQMHTGCPNSQVPVGFLNSFSPVKRICMKFGGIVE